MAHTLSPLETGHRGPILAAVLDHFGRYLATGSEDQEVRIWAILVDEVRRPVAQLVGHTASVLDVAWSHPKFGPLLASCGEDQKVLVWRGPPLGQPAPGADGGWRLCYTHEVGSEVLAIQYGPWEYGVQLACACADGNVTVLSLSGPQPPQPEQLVWKMRSAGAGALPLTPSAGPSLPPLLLPGLSTVRSGSSPDLLASDAQALGSSGGTPDGGPGGGSEDGRWQREVFHAHKGGCFCLCWAPAASPVRDTAAGGGDRRQATVMMQPRRIVTGGADKQVRIWRHDVQTNSWADQHHFLEEAHGAWIRDVAWRPNVGIPANVIASCAEDGKIAIWSQAMVGQPWCKKADLSLEEGAAWQVAWSVTGSILAVTSSSQQVHLFKETLISAWEEVNLVTDQGLPLVPGFGGEGEDEAFLAAGEGQPWASEAPSTLAALSPPRARGPTFNEVIGGGA